MSWVKIDNDLTMYYDVDDFSDPWKTPETILLHHGNSKNSHFWYSWIPLLARQYRVVRFDARGFGQSSVPPAGYPWSLSGFARDVKLLLDYLELDKVHFVGESMGGSIGMQFAYEYPTRLRGLTVCNSPFRFTNSFYTDAADKQEKEGVLAFARESMYRRLDPSQVDPGLVAWYTDQMGKTSQQVAVETLRALAGNDLSDVLRQIRVPTLILSAENRPGYTSDYVQEMKQLIRNSELVVFKGATGYIQATQPEKCVEVLLAFIGKLGNR